MVFFLDLVLNMRGVSEVLILCVFFGNYFFVLKTSRNAAERLILLFKMKGCVISDHFLMLWFQKDSLITVGGLGLTSGGPES